MQKLILFLVLMSVSFVNNAQINKYNSMSASVSTYFIDMNNYREATNPPPTIAVGGGVAYGFSIKEEFNITFGLDVLHYKPNNSRGYYTSLTDSLNYFLETSYLPIIKTTQFHIPIGFEFYSNGNYILYHSFFLLSIIPTFSMSENLEMVVYDKTLVETDRYFEKSSSFKFQDFYAAIAVGNDFNLTTKYKIFVEPSFRISLLNRDENFVNPRTLFSVKVGVRTRRTKKE